MRFVRDYAEWNSGRLARIPTGDATARVIRLLEQRERLAGVSPARAVASVRIAAADGHGYVVTSVVGNLLLAWHGSRWLVVSLPGD